MLIRDEVITTSGFLETIFGNSPVALAKVKNMHRIWNLSKMLIGDEVITSSGFLETILGGCERLHLPDNRREKA